MTSPLGMKAGVGSLVHTWGRGIHLTKSLRLTSGVTPADHLAASMKAEPFSSGHALVGLETGKPTNMEGFLRKEH